MNRSELRNKLMDIQQLAIPSERTKRELALAREVIYNFLPRNRKKLVTPQNGDPTLLSLLEELISIGEELGPELDLLNYTLEERKPFGKIV